jgi:hypothetical protein
VLERGRCWRGLGVRGADVGQEVFVFETIEELLLSLDEQDLQLVEEGLGEVMGFCGVWVTC